jgi:hypothetical protein
MRWQLLVLLLSTLPAWAQQPATGSSPRAGSKTSQEQELQQLLAFSRPASPHALLGKLVGTWHFQDVARSFVQGTLRRTPLYSGRFYQVDLTGGKLPLPVADGKMLEAPYQCQQLEGYDNGRRQFVTTSINNHIGSDIELQTGTYEAATQSFTYEWEDELVPGQKQRHRRVLRVLNATQYAEDYYDLQNGVATKVRELRYTKQD